MAPSDLADSARPVSGTLRLGGRVVVLERVTSTNALLQDLAREGEPEGTVVVAEEQTAGRGRRGRSWLSPPGTGLWCSVLFRPPGTVAGLLTFAAAVAVREAIAAATGLQAGIKWPNDVLLDGRKVCGILTELDSRGTETRFAVVGLGINLNQEPGDFPKPLRAAATSLKEAAGVPVHRGRFLVALVRSLDAHYQHLLVDGPAGLMEAWRQGCMHLGLPVTVIQGERTLQGTTLDVAADGTLVLETAAGIERVVAGDVSLRTADDI